MSLSDKYEDGKNAGYEEGWNDAEVRIKELEQREQDLIKFCIKYFSLNVSAVSGEHIPKVEKFKKELKEFIEARS